MKMWQGNISISFDNALLSICRKSLITGADLIRDYRNERAVELHLEDTRFFDLLRWKAAPGNIDLNPIRGLTEVTMDWSDAKEGDLLGELNYTYGEITAVDPRSR